MFYDTKFGRKKPTSTESQDSRSQPADKVVTNGNGHVQSSSDAAIYEQFRNQVLFLDALAY